MADRENNRVLAYSTKTGHAEVLSSKTMLVGKPYAIYTNGSSDWPMYGVFGGESGVLGFSLDSRGRVINTWGPEGVSEENGDRLAYMTF